ncbi:LysM peptidoglycan-binding domain-containing protein [Aerococcaceae bacterium zg-BR9]|uniref:LysM peptidoglycan-binding domain-containing protein n=1 Tax=Aerococcaceae bacterium zg-1292 TaxID=2774330 RepID=UPI004064A6E6|nr:LysM peptidoglycan-binding domain-containing protein [Aerococcaceae bacterium zg-BR9]
MPILSRRVAVQLQKKRQKLERMKQVRKSVNAGVVLFSAATVLQSVNTQTVVRAEDAITSSRVSKSQFLGFISEQARKIAASNDLYASVMIAQAALESGWGNSSLSRAPHYNLFGIKGSYNNSSVKKNTLEDDGSGNYYQATEQFRSYDSYASSLSDYAALLTGNNDPTNWRYNFYKGARVSQTSSYQDATAHLTGKYATDTRYGSKLNAIIQENNLTAYDTLRQSNALVNPTTTTTTTTTATRTTTPATPAPSASTAAGSYTVAAGDTYWALSKRFGVSVAELQALNAASGSSLYVGQTIKIPSQAPSAASTSSTTTTTTVTTKQADKTAPVASTTSSSYTVVAGDTYWALAKRFGVSVAELQALNAASGSSLYVGQSIKVPGQKTAPTVSSTTTVATTSTTPAPTTSQSTSTRVTTTTTTTSSSQYTVTSGDTYWGIARRYGVSVNDLIAANGNNRNYLAVGQKLVIPGKTATAATTTVSTRPTTVNSTPAPTQTTTPAATTGNYTVVAGDSLYAIASRHGISISQLMQANGLSQSSIIHPGQRLVVSNTAAAPSAVASTPTSTVPTASTATPTVTQTTSVQATPAVATPTPVAASGSHTVVAGDTLYSLAKRFGVSVDTLIQKNGGSTNIRVGQVINY